jgi:hypothetical protein
MFFKGAIFWHHPLVSALDGWSQRVARMRADDKLRDTHQLHLMEMMGFAASTLRSESLFKLRSFRLRKPPVLTARPAQVICPSGGFLTGLSSLISDFQKNISVPTHPKSHLELFASHPTRGAYHDRHGRGVGCGGRGSVLRATGSQGGLTRGL